MTADETNSAEHEARVAVELGGLCVQTQADTLGEAEESFYRIWEHVLDDTDEMTAAMRERLGGFQ